MSFSRQMHWIAPLAVALLAITAEPVEAQFIGPRVNGPRLSPYRVPSFTYPQAAQQYLFNNSVVGQSLRRDLGPFAYGVNPYARPIIVTGPAFPPAPYYPFNPAFPPYSPITASPYALSTVAAPSSYPTGATLSTSGYGGYSLSTTGSTIAAPPPLAGGYGGYGGYGFGVTGDITAGTTLQGAGYYVQSYGQYLMNTQQASRMREDVRQAKLDTYRKQVQYEAWYESMRMTSNQMRQRELAGELETARNEAPVTQIYSGKSLNDLMRSVTKLSDAGSRLNRGPQIDLTDINLKNVHVSARDGGNVGLLKAERNGELQLSWPTALEGKAFEDWQPELSRHLREAVATLKKGGEISKSKLQDIDNLWGKMNEKLNERETAEEMSPSQYIEASRYLKQLKSSVSVLRSRDAGNYFNDTWKARGRTVSELADNMIRNGLEFAPATPGDESAYMALYQALRAFEGGLASELTTKSVPK